ncbi:unnamed protein product [Miscanthus lutarioriparius]|uniref:C2 domain-containing protein n=1 Tax=Miscanthus lutarioriparius TaxID=422564 RepID=A0A811RYH1_9POAL|nr:unnamed protein product [Miscanthus lutarioriparius]
MGKGSAPAEPEPAVLLHGDLDIRIVEAKCFASCSCGRPATKKRIITSDPYVSVCVAGATVAQTRVIPNTENPRWEEHFRVEVAHAAARVEFHVKDNDVFGAQLIGVAAVPVAALAAGWFPVEAGQCGAGAGSHSQRRPAPELHLSIRYEPIDGNPLYSASAGAGHRYSGVPNAYFPLRRGGAVTLYQDAHVAGGNLPAIEIDGGRVYEHGRCWEDICHAIAEAHHLVYVVGWSIYHPVRLVRETTRPLAGGTPPTLGELLKGKVHEGVRVVMLIWDDKTSHDKFLLKTVLYGLRFFLQEVVH